MKSFVDLNHLTLLTPTKAKLFSDSSKRWYKQAKAKNAEKLIKLVVVSGVGEVVLVVGAKRGGGQRGRTETKIKLLKDLELVEGGAGK